MKSIPCEKSSGIFSFVPSIARVLRTVALGPVFAFAGIDGTRLMREEFGDVDRLLVGQRAALSERHVVLDEGRCGIGARHAGAVVERIHAPQRRECVATAIRPFDPFALSAMAAGALIGVD